ncbi:hypothetical protein RhiirA4_463926 [Rhizophagus irregularis]|uniref:Uncharacterized protein n=1 Tax=Rhizophagus irregularis TaxID=588596 RepID=A0A2I1GNW5_9GLOM|nr:hypothetical protein RhiirA4_463926 [Rhizophagus irregularis]
MTDVKVLSNGESLTKYIELFYKGFTDLENKYLFDLYDIDDDDDFRLTHNNENESSKWKEKKRILEDELTSNRSKEEEIVTLKEKTKKLEIDVTEREQIILQENRELIREKENSNQVNRKFYDFPAYWKDNEIFDTLKKRLDKIEKETTTTETSSRKGKDKIVEPEEDNINENKKLAMASQGTELIMTANKQFFPP